MSNSSQVWEFPDTQVSCWRRRSDPSQIHSNDQRDDKLCPDMRMFNYPGITLSSTIFSGDSLQRLSPPRWGSTYWRPANSDTDTGYVLVYSSHFTLKSQHFRKSGKFQVYCKERLSVETVNIERPQCKSYFVISHVKRRRRRILEVCSQCGVWG